MICHACHNAKCSNPNHLYWGDTSDNIQDSKDNGTFKSIWEHQVEKLGEKKAKEMLKKKGFQKGNKVNKGRHGKRTDEQKRKISEGVKRNWIECKKK